MVGNTSAERPWVVPDGGVGQEALDHHLQLVEWPLREVAPPAASGMAPEATPTAGSLCLPSSSRIVIADTTDSP